MNTINRHYRLERINEYEALSDLFDDIPHLPQDLLDFRHRPDAWTVREHLVHVVETEVIAFHRYRKAIAEPGAVIPGYEGEVWAVHPHLGYAVEHVEDWLDLYRTLRKISARHLRRLIGTDWSGFSWVHEGKGPVDLPEWLELYLRHPREHRDMIDEILWSYRDQTSEV